MWIITLLGLWSIRVNQVSYFILTDKIDIWIRFVENFFLWIHVDLKNILSQKSATVSINCIVTLKNKS